MKPEDKEGFVSIIAEGDVYDAAKQMIEFYANEAATKADLRVSTLLDEGDIVGALVWRRIIDAINIIQGMAPPELLN